MKHSLTLSKSILAIYQKSKIQWSQIEGPPNLPTTIPCVLRICQLLERLVFPPKHASVLLHLSLPVASDDDSSVQPASFQQNLKALESEVWKEGDSTLEAWIWFSS